MLFMDLNKYKKYNKQKSVQKRSDEAESKME